MFSSQQQHPSTLINLFKAITSYLLQKSLPTVLQTDSFVIYPLHNISVAPYFNMKFSTFFRSLVLRVKAYKKKKIGPAVAPVAQSSPSTTPISQTVHPGGSEDSLSLAVINDAGICRLPNELLFEIFGSGLSGVDLSCLRWTCRRFVSVATSDDFAAQLVSNSRHL